jgi:hypothetical protein
MAERGAIEFARGHALGHGVALGEKSDQVGPALGGGTDVEFEGRHFDRINKINGIGKDERRGRVKISFRVP